MAPTTLPFLAILVATINSAATALVTPNIPLKTGISKQPIAKTVLFVPPDKVADNVVFLQKATNCRIKGKTNLTRACLAWENDFEKTCRASILRVSTLSEHEFIVQWNVSWVPPSAAWLEAVGETFFTPEYVTYNHLSNQVSTFSYKAVYTLVSQAVTTGKLRIPTACIEGISFCRIDSTTGNLVSVQEDLSYAMDLSRGMLQNSKCTNDLDYFLQVARRPQDVSSIEEQENHLRDALAWSTVPGFSNSLYVEPNDEDEVGIVYFGIVVVVLVVFANTIGHVLIG